MNEHVGPYLSRDIIIFNPFYPIVIVILSTIWKVYWYTTDFQDVPDL